ncbi:MAG TPA: L-lactate permease [Verrucomicrobiae bacterium]|nr:L-lactate permease [Verrucomicrobiae bacterium]
MTHVWSQNYDPLHSAVWSTLAAALPAVILLGSIALARIRIHLCALLCLAAALAIALWIYHMPSRAAGASIAYGAVFGLFPIGWILLNVIFLYQLTVKRGLFDQLRDGLAHLAPDPRLQVILIAFSFGAFIEGIAGFGAPVAITAAILMQLGFKPLHASGLALIANTAPVAFGSLGIPITTLQQVTGLSALKLSAMVGRQLPFFSVLVPFWVVAAFAGWRGMVGIWPAALVSGLAFAVPQVLVSNLHGPWLVDTISASCSIGALIALLRFWRPKSASKLGLAAASPGASGSELKPAKAPRLRAWFPWVILTGFMLLWGLPQVKRRLDRIAAPRIEVPGLHHAVQRMPPVAVLGVSPKPAEFTFNFLSATGTGILLADLVAGLAMGFNPGTLIRTYLESFWRIRFSLLTIAAMLALGTLTKYCGIDATLGLALARTGRLYPFFGTLLGWLGVALTGSDTASNALFGSLQRITAEQTHLSPILMCAANSSGGVMGKMIDAQSIVVASTATDWYGHEGRILRYLFFHSLALAVLMGILVLLQACCSPLTRLVVR